ncbi:heparinase II/III family protein [Echinicola sediminis]
MKNKIEYFKKVVQTVSHLKPIQVAYQLKNRLIKPGPLSKYQIDYDHIIKLKFFDLPEVKEVCILNEKGRRFTFLNLDQEFEGQIDWNFQKHGKLWNYNLQYADFLRQDAIPVNERFCLICDLYKWLWEGKLPLEPYPASLRIMNVIRFLCTEERLGDKLLLGYLKAEINYLSQNLEYHLLGNHLLENAFALLMGGSFFNVDIWKRKAVKLLSSQLKEQILNDGAHFELSPMYHQIMLFRVFEAFYFTGKNNKINDLFKEKAESMLSWLNNISFRNGDIPHFNDSSNGIAWSSNQLNEIARKLNIDFDENLLLSGSGYRKFLFDEFEIVVDVNGISPTYQPGHAHADTFSFCLNYNDEPIIVDTGTSTYTISNERNYERSTQAHNTLVIDEENSSDIWAGFRVGKRALVTITEDTGNKIIAHHNGYAHKGIVHERTFSAIDKQLSIKDRIIGKSCTKANFYIHFHPRVKIEKWHQSKFLINNNLFIKFEGVQNSLIEQYQFCEGFNNTLVAQRINIELLNKKEIEVSISKA